MSHDYVDVARYNQSLVLGEITRRLSQPGGAHAEHILTAVVCHRVLGVCALLQDADVEGFADRLARAGQARLAFLEHAARSGQPVAPEHLLASDNAGLSDALATGDMETARAIARLSPQRHAVDLEYEEDFLFSRFLHLWLLEPRDDAALDSVLARWAQVLDGGADGRLDVCRSLHARDAGRLPDAVLALVEERKREWRDYRKQLDFDPEVGATTAKIYLDGLALLRLAELAGLPPVPESELLPALARIPLGTPLPPEGAWRTA